MIGFRQKGWHRKEPGIEIFPEKAYIFNQMLFHAFGEEYIGESKPQNCYPVLFLN